jgi:hypothetical protein
MPAYPLAGTENSMSVPATVTTPPVSSPQTEELGFRPRRIPFMSAKPPEIPFDRQVPG